MAYERHYKVETQYMTAKEIHDKVEKDSANLNFKWISSVTSLLEICDDASFPKDYAKKIKIHILDCLTDFELIGKNYIAEYNDAAYSCYNSLSCTDNEEAQARHKYLVAVIKSASKNYFDFESYHLSAKYNELCEKWREEKFACYKSFKKLNFERVKEALHSDFERTMSLARERGEFK